MKSYRVDAPTTTVAVTNDGPSITLSARVNGAETKLSMSLTSACQLARELEQAARFGAGTSRTLADAMRFTCRWCACCVNAACVESLNWSVVRIRKVSRKSV